MLDFNSDISDEDLLRECDVETFRSGGKGGQHVNTTESAVRLRHRPTEVVVTSQQERSQHRNKAVALRNLRRKLTRLAHKRAPRIPTRVPRGVKEQTLKEKAAHALKKKQRAKLRRFDTEE